MPNVEQRWAVAQAQIPHRELVCLTEPLVIRLLTEAVTPGVIHVELHTVPIVLAEIDLQPVVISVAAIGHVVRDSGAVLPGSNGIGLKEVHWIRARRIKASECSIGTVRDGIPYEIADVGISARRRAKRTGQGASQRAYVPLVQHDDIGGVAVIR